MRKVVLVIVLAATAAVGVRAQEGAEEVVDAAWGLRFTPPLGWVPEPVPDGYLYVSGQQLLAVLPHEARTVEALRSEAEAGLYDESGTALRLDGALEAFGPNGLAGFFSGAIEGSPARARIIGLVAPVGPGVTIVAATPPSLYTDELAATAAWVAESVTFEARGGAEAGGASAAQRSDEAREWADWLRGCRLSYFSRYDSGYGGGGYSDETVIDLCSGYFTLGSRSETVFNTPDLDGSDAYTARQGGGAGGWEVVDRAGQPTLVLRFHDGSSRTYGLSYEDGKTYLDGERWLRTCDPADAVAEARPQCH